MDTVSWNVFRLLADFLHLGGMSFGLAAIVSSRSVAGFSRKTQVLFQLVFVSRYLDIFTQHQGLYLLFFKVRLRTAFMLWLFHKLHQTYEAAADSCNLLALVAPAAILAWLSGGMGLREEAWTFSELLEPLALIPQYIVCYRVRAIDARGGAHRATGSFVERTGSGPVAVRSGSGHF
ncbi:ER lumen protein-retaining receptor [Durusdinium trenchii]|uniref:ER lumen protein-retaining receptor n=1 Tax=Durusdinium trenchii TaxID=1381693 RepID=A0ABP0HBW6_9DINO